VNILWGFMLQMMNFRGALAFSVDEMCFTLMPSSLKANSGASEGSKLMECG
jgi:hypothetical protein